MALDLLRRAGVVLEDLRRETQPALAEIKWGGRVVDVASAEGIAAAGATIANTQAKAADWRAAGLRGVVCRSASMARQGFVRWMGDHRGWGELAIFVRSGRSKPILIKRLEDPGWLRAPGGSRRVKLED